MKVIPFSASAEELGSLLRAYAVEIPRAVIRAINVRPELVGRTGPGVEEMLGVLPGMNLASVTRASYSARVQWFQSIDWSRVPRWLRGLSPVPPSEKVADGKD